jgi:hypothetical protein
MQYADDGVTKLITYHDIPKSKKSSVINIDKEVMEQNYHDHNINALIKDWYKIANYIAWKLCVSSYYIDDYKQIAVIHMNSKLHLYNPNKKSKLFSYSWTIIYFKILDCRRKHDLHKQIVEKWGVEIIPLEKDMTLPQGNSEIYFENNKKTVSQKVNTIPEKIKPKKIKPERTVAEIAKAINIAIVQQGVFGEFKELSQDIKQLELISKDLIRDLKIFKNGALAAYNGKKNEYVDMLSHFIMQFTRMLTYCGKIINEEAKHIEILGKNPELYDMCINSYTNTVKQCKSELNDLIIQANCLLGYK